MLILLFFLIKNKSNSVFQNLSRSDLFDHETNTYKIDLNNIETCCNLVSTSGETWFSYLTQQNSLCCYKFSNRLETPFKIEVNQSNNAKKIWSVITRYTFDIHLSKRLNHKRLSYI